MTQMKTFDVEIVSSGDSTLPPSGQVQLSLLDVSLADAPAISLADLRLHCGGLMPINLQLTFDSSQIDPRHRYALSVRIEKDGQLLYINTRHHPIKPDTALGTQRVTVDKIATGDDGKHGSNHMD
ncbi:YbaY family lipoprotein [Pseudomonas sp. LRP2-20]|uniref:YbaY family lipoprotein n=1 Tax=Pseudomonas sp. LRP2-20 TaxID=2944234 RepID=UPI0021881DAD|nr:YbaY family lipoprotein [Pseudomonas sp. LRP2-20]BDM21323.1 YbaY family lipoprotein [Pseudomonas sp. LRP2-20]